LQKYEKKINILRIKQKKKSTPLPKNRIKVIINKNEQREKQMVVG